MKLIGNMLQRVRNCKSYLDGGDAVKEQLVPREQRIHHEQSEQLLEGKRPDGGDIRPYYSEDPYFKLPGQWQDNPEGYKAWKSTKPYWNNPRRKPDAPNLYINGKFHSELGVYFEADAITIDAATAYAAEIVGKYGHDTFGLSMERWNKLMKEVLPEIRRRVREIIIYGNV